MLEAMLSSPFFGLGLTCAAWCVGVFLQKKTGFLLCNPMLIATIVVVAVLAVFRIPYADYLQGQQHAHPDAQPGDGGAGPERV